MSEKIHPTRCTASAARPPSAEDCETVHVKFWPPPKKFQANTTRLPELPKARKNSLFSDFVDTVRDLLVRDRRVGFQKPK